MTDSATIRLMADYKAWADTITFGAVAALPEAEALKDRGGLLFRNMVHTLNHIYVIDDIFRHHLEGRAHGYTARNTESHPPMAELMQMQQEMDRWYQALAARLSAAELDERIEFEFIGGGRGNMSRAEIILHLVNHSTYHRGYVADMLYQVPAAPPASDLPVYLRDVVRAGA